MFKAALKAVHQSTQGGKHLSDDPWMHFCSTSSQPQHQHSCLSINAMGITTHGCQSPKDSPPAADMDMQLPRFARMHHGRSYKWPYPRSHGLECDK